MRLASRKQRPRGIGRVAAAALAAALATPVVIATSPASAESDARAGSDAVSIDVVSISPNVPAPSQHHLNKLRVELSITNHTNEQLNNVEITATRGLPLDSPAQLTAALDHPVAPTSGQSVAAVHPPVKVDLPPGNESAAVPTTFVTTTGVPTNAGLCLCQNAQVYPIWFQAYGTVNGATQLLGQTQTFVPSYFHRPNPIQVSWVWPLIDRPHRILGSTQFTDDRLASSVSTGRLNRCLQVLKNVASTVPVTVVIDPELLDELQIMATQHYTYRTATGQYHRGTAQDAAQARAWLTGLQTVLRDNPDVSVVLTPNADPDVGSLARAQLPWPANLPSAEQRRVQEALGGVTPSTGIAWPPTGTIDGATLSELKNTGVRSLLLSSVSARPNTNSSTTPFTLARLAAGRHPVVAALTPPDLSRYVAAALGGDATGSGLPELMASLALHAGANTAGQEMFLAPPRYIDPAVPLATDAIERSSSSMLTQPANLVDVLAAADAAPLQQAPSAVPAHLVASPHVPSGLSPANLRIAQRVTNQITSLKSMFGRDVAASRFVTGLNDAVQRIESAAWLRGSGLGGRQRGVQFARRLQTQMRPLKRSVHIVVPASRSRRYTLASTNSPLPITVANDLSFPVHVEVAVQTVNGTPGLNAPVFGPQVVAPHSKSTLRVPTQVQRSGLFRVYATLHAPDGQQIGRRVPLSVTSTALGAIGVVITVVSGAILALALLVRFVRRMRARRRQPPPRPDTPAPSGPAPLRPEEPAEPKAPEEPVAPLTETLTSPGAAPPPAAPGH